MKELIDGKKYLVRIRDPKEYLNVTLNSGTVFYDNNLYMGFMTSMWSFAGKKMEAEWNGKYFKGSFNWIPEWVEVIRPIEKEIKIDNHWFSDSGKKKNNQIILERKKVPLNLAEAWEMSLNKWWLHFQHPGKIKENYANCGLCHLFRDSICQYCPIVAETEKNYCISTPYDAYADNPTKENAEKELNFLVSLAEENFNVELINNTYKVSERKVEVDWTKVPVDTKILVRDSEEDEWKKRYFAKLEDGRVRAFIDGQTSWSTSGSGIYCSWAYSKLWEGGE